MLASTALTLIGLGSDPAYADLGPTTSSERKRYGEGIAPGQAESWSPGPTCVRPARSGDPEVTFDRNRIERIDPIVFAYEDSVSAADSAYVSTLAREVIPLLLEIVGPPHDLDTLRFRISDGEWYAPVTSDLGMTPIQVDRDSLTGKPLPNSVRWDNAFVHELTHAFLRVFYLIGPQWAEEGIAEAARYFVAEAMREAGSPRRMMDPRTSLNMALADGYDRGGSSLSGGIGWYPFRANGEAAYRGAAAAILIPCFAERAEGRNFPHPLRRFVDAAVYENARQDRCSISQAADSAWSSPIDGAYPPSRWLQSRSVAWGDAPPDSVYLAVLPDLPSTPVNPKRLQLFVYRVFLRINFYRRIVSGRMVFTAADGHRWESTSAGGVSAVPELPAGAYLVEAEAQTEWPEAPTVRGRNWIIVTSTGRPLLDSSEGIAVIFADSTGKPVDLPDLTVNGRVVERVPGGIVVAPYAASGSEEMLTLRDDDRVLGSVTVPGRFSRAVVIDVDETISRRGVSWKPYRPFPGDSLTVFLRRNVTTLDPRAPSVSLFLAPPGHSSWEERPMRKIAGAGDLWVARARMPEDAPAVALHFKAGATEFGAPSGWNRHEVRSLPTGGCPISGVEWDRDGIVLAFEGPVDDRSLILQRSAADGTDGWSDTPNRPFLVEGDPARLRFDLPVGAASIRIIWREAAEDHVLMTFRVGPYPGRSRITAGAPFPNPARDGVHWSIDASAPVLSELRIYDLTGRLVAGPIEQQLLQGPQELRWSGLTGDRLSAGVYFLKLTIDEDDAIRKIVLLPGQSR